MELTLTKTQNYKLEPYGRFLFKWQKPKVEKPNHIPICELHMFHDTAMPMSKEMEKAFVKAMKKFKTDVFTDGEKFYTLTNSGMTEVKHKKLGLYRDEPAYKDAVDNATWK